MRKLKTLYRKLKKLGQDMEADELRKLIRETEEDPFLDLATQTEEESFEQEEIQTPEARMPQFDWLFRGNLFKNFKRKSPFGAKEFIDLNSDLLVQFGEPKYVGSGMMGDAFELPTGNILKIFDANSWPGGSRPPLTQYREMQDAQWNEYEGAADEPMIHGLGRFKDSPAINISRITEFSRGGFIPAYVIMEKVETPSSLADRYIRDSGDTLKREIETEVEVEDEFGEEGDTYIDYEYEWNDDFKLEEIYDIYESSELLSDWAKRNYGEIQAVPPEDMVKHLVQAYITSMTNTVLKKIEEYEETEFEDAEDADNFDSEEEWLDERYDFEEESELRDFIRFAIKTENMMGQEQNLKHASDDIADLVERILGINRRGDLEKGKIIHGPDQEGWLSDVIIAAYKQKVQGRSDVHAGNFGFRKSVDKDGNPYLKPVFFDA